MRVNPSSRADAPFRDMGRQCEEIDALPTHDDMSLPYSSTMIYVFVRTITVVRQLAIGYSSSHASARAHGSPRYVLQMVCQLTMHRASTSRLQSMAAARESRLAASSQHRLARSDALAPRRARCVGATTCIVKCGGPRVAPCEDREGDSTTALLLTTSNDAACARRQLATVPA